MSESESSESEPVITHEFRIMGNRRAGESPTETDSDWEEGGSGNEPGPVVELSHECDTHDQALSLAALYRKTLPGWSVWAERLVMEDGDLDQVQAIMHWRDLFIVIIDDKRIVSAMDAKELLLAWRDLNAKRTWTGPYGCRLGAEDVIREGDGIRGFYEVEPVDIDWDGFKA